eukprot:UC4_evm1s261
MSLSQNKHIANVVHEIVSNLRISEEDGVDEKSNSGNVNHVNRARDMLEGWGEAFIKMKSETLDLIGVLKLMETLGMTRTRAEVKSLFPNLTSSQGSVRFLDPERVSDDHSGGGLIHRLQAWTKTLPSDYSVDIKKRVPTRHRAVSLNFLRDLYQELKDLNRNQFSSNELVDGKDNSGNDPICIRALTRKTGVSLVESFILAGITKSKQDGSKYFGTTTAFLSYSWGMSEFDTTMELIEDAQKKLVEDEEIEEYGIFVWVDILAVSQNKDTSHQKAAYAEDLANFETVIQTAKQTILAWSPWHKPVTFSRVWCLYEIMTTLNVNMAKEGHLGVAATLPHHDIVSFGNALRSEGSQSVFDSIAKIDAREAEATVEADLIRIFKLIENSIGFAEVNSRIAAAMREQLIPLGNAVVQNAEETWGAKSHNTFLTKARFGELLMRLHRHREAEDILLDALRDMYPLMERQSSTKRKNQGPELVKILCETNVILAQVKQESNHTKEALDIFNDVISTCENIFGDSSPILMKALDGKAKALKFSRNATNITNLEAEKTFRKLIRVQTKAFGEHGRKTLLSSTHLASLLFENEHATESDIIEAERMLFNVVNIYKEIQDDKNAEATYAMFELAKVLKIRNRREEALHFASESLERRVQLYGPHDKRTIAVQKFMSALDPASRRLSVTFGSNPSVINPVLPTDIQRTKSLGAVRRNEKHRRTLEGMEGITAKVGYAKESLAQTFKRRTGALPKCVIQNVALKIINKLLAFPLIECEGLDFRHQYPLNQVKYVSCTNKN